MADSTLEVGILGAEGRMGQALIQALSEHKAARLSVALVSPSSANIGKNIGELKLSSDIAAALNACDVMIDFSRPQAAIDTVLAMHGTRCQSFVTGTTGYSGTEEAALKKASERITLLKSGNFSLGVAMLEVLVEQAAAALNTGWDIEISEMHHKDKVDAPSGTALMLGGAAARGRGVALGDVRREQAADQISGQREGGAIGFSSLRAGGVIGDHDVHITSALEQVTLSHRALDRQVFAAGALTAALWAAKQNPGLYTMRDVLGL